MNLKSLCKEGGDILKSAGIFEYETDAGILLLHTFNIKLQDFILDGNIQISDKENEISAYRELIKKRAAHIPLQYLTGSQNFCGLDFYVNPNVLIPRYDTEILVEKIIKENRDKDIVLLDMCTGSGCIAIALKKLSDFKKVYALDISKSALEVCGYNIKKHEAEIEPIESDMFENIGFLKGSLDIIVSNPPYIPKKDIDALMPEVKEHEPILALVASDNGLEFYKRIAQNAKSFLKENGRVYLEIGYNQADAVSDIFKTYGMPNIEVTKDLAGFDRVISVYL